MSLKYIYHQITSLLLAAIVAWNSFGYAGVMIGSFVILEMHHDQEQCEKTFCYCDVSDGLKICVCHHQNEQEVPEGNHEAPADCYLDIYPNDFAHNSSLIQWDSRTFILNDFDLISISVDSNLYPVPPTLELPQGVRIAIERPPAMV